MPTRIRTVVVFGDSLSDIGQKWSQPMGMFANNTGLMVVNATGRFSDCRNWTDFMYEEAAGSSLIVSDAGLSYELSSAYMTLSPKSWITREDNVTEKNFQYVNYAEGGACGDTPATMTNRMALGTFKDQVDKFEENCKSQEISLGNTLFIIWFGANDLYTAGSPPLLMSKVANQVASTQRTRLNEIVKKKGGRCWFLFVDIARPLASVRYSMRLKEAKKAVKKEALQQIPQSITSSGYKPIGGYVLAAREQGWAKKQLEDLDKQMQEIKALEDGVNIYNSCLHAHANVNGDRVVKIGSLFTEDTIRALVRANKKLKSGANTDKTPHISSLSYDILSNREDFSTHISTVDQAHPTDAVYRLIWKEIYKVITDTQLVFGGLTGLTYIPQLSVLASSLQ